MSCHEACITWLVHIWIWRYEHGVNMNPNTITRATGMGTAKYYKWSRTLVRTGLHYVRERIYAAVLRRFSKDMSLDQLFFSHQSWWRWVLFYAVFVDNHHTTSVRDIREAEFAYRTESIMPVSEQEGPWTVPWRMRNVELTKVKFSAAKQGNCYNGALMSHTLTTAKSMKSEDTPV